ncbi:MAG: histone deacetylase, partial [Candidatus Dadabacteria bacterium]|nr:histone deacetylase [Candidatus Dadabacteria bacterium]
MGDDEFIRIFEEILKPIIDQYKPEFILVSAGFDIYFEDPLGGMKVSPEGFAKLTRLLTDEADKICDGKIVFLHEGRSNLDGLWISTKEVIEELLDKKKTEYKLSVSETNVDPLIDKIKKIYSDYWEF